MQPAPLEEMLPAIRRGDERVCREFVERLYPTVISIVRKHRPRGDDDEDLAQEVFMKVFAKIDQFAGKQPLSHWVSRIATNTCYDRLRRQKVRPVHSFAELDIDEAEFLERALIDESSPSETDGESAAELVEKLLSTLNPREQTVIRLLDLAEHSVRETCNLTGWSASKVKVTAHRARRKLRQALMRLEATTPLKPNS